MNNIKGLLMRVGIDQTYGKYNAPINPSTNDYIYLPIPTNSNISKAGMETTYYKALPYIKSWGLRNDVTRTLPPNLMKDKNQKETGDCHLDPDFDFSTYGDQSIESGRGRRVSQLNEGDFIAFFASFKPITPCEHNLIYALYGIMFVDKVLRVADVPEEDMRKNAHTRVIEPNKEDLVVFAKSESSGRFSNAIPIGEFRDGSYRVTKEILYKWGDICVKDGFIQRSACPPWFTKPEQFLDWFNSKQITLINNNWG